MRFTRSLFRLLVLAIRLMVVTTLFQSTIIAMTAQTRTANQSCAYGTGRPGTVFKRSTSLSLEMTLLFWLQSRLTQVSTLTSPDCSATSRLFSTGQARCSWCLSLVQLTSVADIGLPCGAFLAHNALIWLALRISSIKAAALMSHC